MLSNSAIKMEHVIMCISLKPQNKFTITTHKLVLIPYMLGADLLITAFHRIFREKLTAMVYIK